MVETSPAGPPLTAADLDLYERVFEAIQAQDVVRETEPPLRIAVADGVVTISGVVLTRIMHERVLYVAASTPGVKKVIDELYTDPEIENTVAAALVADPGLNGAAVDVSSYKGSITVYGHMPDVAQREKALAVAVAVPGVRNVIDRLEAAPQES
jgi:osmotically-inducible protein OsmY